MSRFHRYGPNRCIVRSGTPRHLPNATTSHDVITVADVAGSREHSPIRIGLVCTHPLTQSPYGDIETLYLNHAFYGLPTLANLVACRPGCRSVSCPIGIFWRFSLSSSTLRSDLVVWWTMATPKTNDCSTCEIIGYDYGSSKACWCQGQLGPIWSI